MTGNPGGKCRATVIKVSIPLGVKVQTKESNGLVNIRESHLQFHGSYTYIGRLIKFYNEGEL